MTGNYGPSGSLFTNDRKEQPNHPDYEGYCEFDEATVRSLVDQMKAGETPKCDLKGWKKKSNKTGKSFLSLAAKPPFKRNSGGGSGGSFSDFGTRGGQPRDSDPF
jgi:hypothetical protein